ncbi:MAG: DUF1573 domain-containing protein [Bacteroidaceae bacterium]|nr:DUF1573 domain-containing protein [Bacteroidaceae bacterium]
MGFGGSASAQNIDAEFDVIDMGDITFRQPASATFRLKNRGSEFFLKAVKPFCGCTRVAFPKKNIGKGEKFTVNITYDAEQLGHFQKDVAILSDQFEQPYYLTVKGNVVARKLNDNASASEASVSMGKMRLSRDNVEFADAYQGDLLHEKITITNLDSQPINPQVVHVPQYMTAQITPNVIQPGRQGVITFTLNANMLPRYGLTQSTVYIVSSPGDNISKDREMLVSAIKLPSLNLSETQRHAVPVLSMSDTQIVLSKSLKGDIILINKGKSPLEISAIQSFTPGLTITLGDTLLDPFESTLLKVKGSKKYLKNLKTPLRILIISNDPERQKTVINVRMHE